MNYQHYSTGFKEAILKKLNQSELSVRKFSQQEGINLSTLYSWQKQFKTTGFSVNKDIPTDQWSSEEKFTAVLETAALSEVELSEYCRRKGLYPEQLNNYGLKVHRLIERTKSPSAILQVSYFLYHHLRNLDDAPSTLVPFHL